MLGNLVFSKRKDCFCHLKSDNLGIISGTIFKVTSTTTQNFMYIACKSTEYNNSNEIELNGLFCWHLNFIPNEEVSIDIIPSNNICYADNINLTLFSNDEWDLINTYSLFMEENFLKQISCVHLGMVFPIWIDKICLILKVEALIPFKDFCVITATTTLTITPNLNQSEINLSKNIRKSSLKNKSEIISYKKKFVMKSLIVIVDFIYYLLFGKTFNQKQRENEIYKKWESCFSIQSDILFNKQLYGRCFRGKVTNYSSTASYLQDHILIEMSLLNYNKSLISGNFLLGTIEKIPFLEKNFQDKPESQFFCLFQISEKVSVCRNRNQNFSNFIIPKNLWEEGNFKIGDRALCKIIEYKKIVIKELNFDVNLEVTPTISEDLIKLFKQNISLVQNDEIPLLIREKMEIPMTVKNETVTLVPKFQISKNSEHQRGFCLISKYFLESGFIKIRFKSNGVIGSIKHVDQTQELIKVNNWLKKNLTYRVLYPFIEGDDVSSGNILIYGSSGIGKSLFCEKLCFSLSVDETHQFFTSFIDCRDLVGKQPDSVRHNMLNILLESLWRSPSIICLENLDLLIPNYFDSENYTENIIFDCLATIVKYFFQFINQIGSRYKIISISTCKSLFSFHKYCRSTVLFKKMVDMSSKNPDLFITVVKDYLKDMENNNNVYNENLIETLSHIKHRFGDTDSLSGFDAVSISKNSFLRAIKRTFNDLSPKSTVQINFSDIDHSFYLSTSYKFSNFNKRKRPIEIYFNDIFGVENIKNELREIFLWPSVYPDLFKNCPIKLPQSVLLYGLPGNGKTLLALSLANEINMNFKMIKGPELLNKYIGASEEQVRKLFDEARKSSPILLFFDEFDSLVPRRGHDSTGVTDRIVNQFLTEIDGISSSNNLGIFILAASNRPDLIDPAILRPGRISRKILCKLPDTVKERVEAIKFFLRQSNISVSEESSSILSYLDLKVNHNSDFLSTYSYADLFSIVYHAEINTILRYSRSDSTSNDQVHTFEMSLLDFQTAVNSSRPSLTIDQINFYSNAYENLIKKTNLFTFKATLA